MKTGTLALSLLALAGLGTSALLLQARSTLLDQVADAGTAAQALETDLAIVRKAHAELTSQLGATQAELTETRTRVSASESAAAELRREVANGRLLLEEAEKRVAAGGLEAVALRETLALTKLEVAQAGADEIAAYQATVARLEEQLAALTTPDSPDSLEPAAPVLPTSVPVLSVGPDNAFVVLGFGATAGARPDHTLEIRRGTETLATVLITGVHPHHAIAQVRPDTLRAGLHKGDLAIITLSP
ncbi:MAG TPA: hypothetical protein VGD88_14155 [Opitutaceae bacterium]